MHNGAIVTYDVQLIGSYLCTGVTFSDNCMTLTQISRRRRYSMLISDTVQGRDKQLL